MTPWMGDQPVAKPSTYIETNRINTDIHVSSELRTHDLSVLEGENSSCLSPRCHCDRWRQIYITFYEISHEKLGTRSANDLCTTEKEYYPVHPGLPFPVLMNHLKGLQNVQSLRFAFLTENRSRYFLSASQTSYGFCNLPVFMPQIYWVGGVH
jgi:hypothetical protein